MMYFSVIFGKDISQKSRVQELPLPQHSMTKQMFRQVKWKNHSKRHLTLTQQTFQGFSNIALMLISNV